MDRNVYGTSAHETGAGVYLIMAHDIDGENFDLLVNASSLAEARSIWHKWVTVDWEFDEEDIPLVRQIWLVSALKCNGPSRYIEWGGEDMTSVYAQPEKRIAFTLSIPFDRAP